jgi:hypothetical protein
MKKHSLLAIVVLALSIVSGPAARAETITFPCGGGASYSVLMPQGVLLDGKKCTGSLLIDSSVKIVDRQAFLGAKITSVIFPSSVTKIDEASFSQTQITNLEIPSTLTELGDLAFASTPLKSVKLPSTLIKISDGLFLRTKLEKIEIPSSVISIGSLALSETELTEIVVPDSVIQIYMKSFAGNFNLVAVSLPDSLQGIWGDAFERNYSLTKISYCGMAKLPTFIIPTSCPPERKAVIDAKLASEKAAEDNAAFTIRITAAKSKYSELNSEIDSLIKQYPSKKSEIELYKKKLALFERIDQVNVANVELNLAGIESKLVAMRSVYVKIARTITCTKGKLTKKVIDVTPKCPAGYKVKK